MNESELINFILYGDIYETPLSILKENYSKDIEYDTEQLIRLSLAASLLKKGIIND